MSRRSRHLIAYAASMLSLMILQVITMTPLFSRLSDFHLDVYYSLISQIFCMGVVPLLVLLALGMNIGISMFAVGFFGCLVAYMVNGLQFQQALNAAFIVFKKIPFTQATNYSFVVIPLFIWMGQLCYYSGMSSGLYDMAHKLLGSLRGGLAMASVAACALFGAICGSSAATAATMGVVALPEMKKHGYDDGLACASCQRAREREGVWIALLRQFVDDGAAWIAEA